MRALLGWWLERRTAYSPQDMARMIHNMNQVVLRTALGKKASGK